MSATESLNRVVRSVEIPSPDPDSPAPILLCDDTGLVIAFQTRDRLVAIARFNPVEAMRFGAPNDGALAGHPLTSHGLLPSGSFVVENSSWILELAGINSVHPVHEPSYYADLRHFVITFRESTFECVARRADSALHPEGGASVWSLLRDAMIHPAA
ncbi:MAG TPA: hypothetical protein VE007_05200 [Thermoanaerobaculia bacterium]|nr:hypothetical protein [Thermoanaerobaculia bacterium]